MYGSYEIIFVLMDIFVHEFICIIVKFWRNMSV